MKVRITRRRVGGILFRPVRLILSAVILSVTFSAAAVMQTGSVCSAAAGSPVLEQSIPEVFRTTKTTRKVQKIKLKKKAKKTYTKQRKVNEKIKISLKVSPLEEVRIKKDIKKSVTEQFEEGSRIKVETTIKTVATTTMVWAASAVVEELGQVSVREAAPKADRRVTNAYEALGFTIKIDPDVAYEGMCSMRERRITLREQGDTVYHELGHFLSFVAGNVDESAKFRKIFDLEKERCGEKDRIYGFQNSEEYFAESFRLYTLEPEFLKKLRPLTCRAVEEAVRKITDAQVRQIWETCRIAWEDS